MQREWMDPRDGTRWVVIVSPFGATRTTRVRKTLAFHRPGERPTWTDVGRDLDLTRIGDQALMDLLDESRRAAEVRGDLRMTSRGGQQRPSARPRA